MAAFKTTLLIADADIEIPLIVTYERHKEWLSPGRESPDEPAHCTISRVVADVPVQLIGFADCDWLIDELAADDAFHSALMADWQSDDDDAAERAWDARRDDAR